MLRERGVSESLLSLLSGDGRRAVVVLEAYLDESGTDNTSRIVAVACYAATHDEWMAFEHQWQPVLDAAGIDCFHGKESRCDRLRPALTENINSRRVQGLVMWVGQDDFGKAGQRFKQTLGNAYSVCAFGCALQMAAWSKENGHGQVAFVLEDGQANVEFVRATLEDMIGDDAFNVAAVAVAKKRAFVPLQAADFLSHCVSTGDRIWLERLLGDGYGRALSGQLTGDKLTELAASADEAWRQHRYRKHQAKLARGRALSR